MRLNKEAAAVFLKDAAETTAVFLKNAAEATAVFLDEATSRIVSGILIVFLAFSIWTISDMSRFNSHGAEKPETRDINELCRINPDTVAWLKIDNTNIDYPVVQGKDNFEYLDLDFNKEFYVGGTLFLESENDRYFRDSYNVIHGHHMAEGMMFGDLDKFLDEDFFSRNRKGTLKTPDMDYRIDIFGVGTADAYDSGIYSTAVDMDAHKKAMSKAAVFMRGTLDPVEKILVLSTCTDSMDDSRTVLFCSLIEKEDKNG